jgi:hypothetical protein
MEMMTIQTCGVRLTGNQIPRSTEAMQITEARV